MTLKNIRKDEREKAKTFNYEDIEFPVKIKDIGEIEKQNNINISLFGHKGEKKHSTQYISRRRKRRPHGGTSHKQRRG